MNELTAILVDLFVIFIAAKIAGEVFERLRQPAVIGELLVGIVIGPHALGLIGSPGAGLLSAFHDDAASAGEALELVYHVIAELGVIVLLFSVGLETRLRDLLDVGVRALAVGVLGIVGPFALGFAYMSFTGAPNIESAFIATALVATSVGITARVLGDMGALRIREARIILGAAVIDDILAMLLLAVVSGMGGGEEANAAGIAQLAVVAVGFTLFAMFAGTALVKRFGHHTERLVVKNAPFVVALALMLGMAALAGAIGIAGIIGAFLAGMMLADVSERYDLEHRTRPLMELLVPFFFVIVGSQVDWRVFLDGPVLGTAAVIILLAIVGKVAGAAIGSWGMPGRSIALVGVGMVPRGEMGLIIAGIGRSVGAIPDELFSVVVIMSVVTTIIVPPMLKLLYRPEAAAAPAVAVPSGHDRH